MTLQGRFSPEADEGVGEEEKRDDKESNGGGKPPTDIPDSVLRIACARTIRGIGIVVTGRHDVRASGNQIVTGGISLAAVDI